MGQQYTHLCAEERGTIMAMKLTGASGRAIAGALDRAPSTIARELGRNGYKAPTTCAALGRPRIAGGYDALRRRPRAPPAPQAAGRAQAVADIAAVAVVAAIAWLWLWWCP